MRILNLTEATSVCGALDGALYLVMLNSSSPEELKRVKSDIFILDTAVLGSALGILSGGSVLTALVGGALGYAAAEWVVRMEAGG
ncbi:MAG: hypothetical protein AB7I18_03880 [Candidatus Berkiella sp.]